MGALWTLHFDGLAEPTNPGIGAWGWYVVRDGERIAYGADFATDRAYTNNEAEYSGLIAGLDRIIGWICKPTAEDNIVVTGDSQLVIYQMTGRYACRSEKLQGLYATAKVIEAGLPCRIDWRWVPREENQVADDLSLQGLRMFGDRFPRVPGKYAALVATEDQRSTLGKLGFECPVYLGRRAAQKAIDDLRVRQC